MVSSNCLIKTTFLVSLILFFSALWQRPVWCPFRLIWSFHEWITACYPMTGKIANKFFGRGHGESLGFFSWSITSCCTPRFSQLDLDTVRTAGRMLTQVWQVRPWTSTIMCSTLCYHQTLCPVQHPIFFPLNYVPRSEIIWSLSSCLRTQSWCKVRLRMRFAAAFNNASFILPLKVRSASSRAIRCIILRSLAVLRSLGKSFGGTRVGSCSWAGTMKGLLFRL